MNLDNKATDDHKENAGEDRQILLICLGGTGFGVERRKGWVLQRGGWCNEADDLK